MSLREIVFYGFYFVCFALAIITGISAPGNSHTPPGSFIIELITLPIGIIAWLIDAFSYKSTKVHKVGLAVNSLLMLCVVLAALV